MFKTYILPYLNDRSFYYWTGILYIVDKCYSWNFQDFLGVRMLSFRRLETNPWMLIWIMLQGVRKKEVFFAYSWEKE